LVILYYVCIALEVDDNCWLGLAQLPHQVSRINWHCVPGVKEEAIEYKLHPALQEAPCWQLGKLSSTAIIMAQPLFSATPSSLDWHQYHGLLSLLTF
jgi:hypothetical protein